MIAVDSNILVYAHREDSAWHDVSSARIGELAESKAPWAIPWPCIHEFFAIVTHPRIYAPPSPAALAVEQIEAWMESPSLVLLAEADTYWNHLKLILHGSRAVGPQVHDARVAALCVLHGVRELWSADRDFTRFPGLSVRNPLISRT
jgi:toxin-antitoxin system PIN domain toxin